MHRSFTKTRVARRCQGHTVNAGDHCWELDSFECICENTTSIVWRLNLCLDSDWEGTEPYKRSVNASAARVVHSSRAKTQQKVDGVLCLQGKVHLFPVQTQRSKSTSSHAETYSSTLTLQNLVVTIMDPQALIDLHRSQQIYAPASLPEIRHGLVFPLGGTWLLHLLASREDLRPSQGANVLRKEKPRTVTLQGCQRATSLVDDTPGTDRRTFGAWKQRRQFLWVNRRISLL